MTDFLGIFTVHFEHIAKSDTKPGIYERCRCTTKNSFWPCKSPAMSASNDSGVVLTPLRPNGHNSGGVQMIRRGLRCASVRFTPGSVQTLSPYTVAYAQKAQNATFLGLVTIFKLFGHKRCRPPYPICEIMASLERLCGKHFFASFTILIIFVMLNFSMHECFWGVLSGGW